MNLKFSCTLIVVILIVHPHGLASPAAAQTAVGEEVREFDIFVDGKAAGKNTMRISQLEDGTTRVATEVDVKLNFVVFVYRYMFSGQETWKGNRLIATHNLATDNGKKYDARAQADARAFRIEANGRSHTAPIIDMTTNYWRPPQLRPDGRLALMNADRGNIQTARVERLSPEVLVFGQQQVTCSHYRLSGDVQAELWFDGQDRIVRQKAIEDGHPTELRLTRLSRQAPRMAARPQPRR